MEGSISTSKKQQAATGVDAAWGGGGKPARRPHWRRRDPADTAVYVVHPTQFRTVVQQLTGVGHHSGGGTTAPEPHQQAAAGTCTNAAAQQQLPQQHGGGASSGRTLGQMQQECMVWANSDDYSF